MSFDKSPPFQYYPPQIVPVVMPGRPPRGRAVHPEWNVQMDAQRLRSAIKGAGTDSKLISFSRMILFGSSRVLQILPLLTSSATATASICSTCVWRTATCTAAICTRTLRRTRRLIFATCLWVSSCPTPSFARTFCARQPRELELEVRRKIFVLLDLWLSDI